MININESMGPGRDRTRNPWICSQTRICSQTCYRLRYAARFEFEPVIQEEVSLKDILCNFGRRHHEEQFCEIILILYRWFRRKCLLKIFLIWSSGCPFVQRSGTKICAILVEDIIRSHSVKSFLIWTSGSGGLVI